LHWRGVWHFFGVQGATYIRPAFAWPGSFLFFSTTAYLVPTGVSVLPCHLRKITEQTFTLLERVGVHLASAYLFELAIALISSMACAVLSGIDRLHYPLLGSGILDHVLSFYG
jgi:hypothetical protein